ncbi:MAG: hypothetical protein IPN42_14520 [Methylococcaceae bacterium]|nr:hypothetical protein [Methylococcaceae bacterium]
MLSKTNIKISLVLSAMLGSLITPNLANAVAGDQTPESTNIMNSSPLYADSGQSYHACNVANITTAALKAKIDLISASGTVLATTGATPISLIAGTSYELIGPSTYTGFARCRVSTVDPENVRANLSVFHYTGTYFETLAFSELR